MSPPLQKTWSYRISIGIALLTCLIIALALLSSPRSSALAGTLTLKQDSVTDFNSGDFFHTGLTQDTRPNDSGDGTGEIRLINQGINKETWRSDGNTSGLPGSGLWGHAATFDKERIYVSGGNDGSSNDSGATTGVFMTTIAANHNLNNWTTLNALPEKRYSHAMVAVNDYLYAIGGIDQDFNVKKTVYKALIKANGTLGAWSSTDDVPVSVGTGIYDTVALEFNGRVYVLGGHTSSGGSLNKVFVGTPDGNGDLTWDEDDTTLPDRVSEHTAAVSSDRIYLVGGVDNSAGPAVASPEGEYLPQVYFALPETSTGDISSWNPTAVLPNNLVHAGGAAFGEQIYVAGGSINTGGEPRSDILSNLIQLNGDLIDQGWIASDVLSSSRIQSAAVMSSEGWLYVIEGGSGLNGSIPLTTIDFGPTSSTKAGQAFAPDGTFTSAPFDLGASRPLERLRWNTSVFADTTITLQYRYADTLNGLSAASWQPGSPLVANSGIKQTMTENLSGNARYLQYRVALTTAEPTVTPILNWVELDFDSPSTPTPTATSTATATKTKTPGGATDTATPTPTKTKSPTKTPTVTKTPNPCAGKPAKPILASPKNKSTVKVRRPKLKWSGSQCQTTKFKLVLKKGTKKGDTVINKMVGKTQLKTKALTKSSNYVWHVQACNGKKCSLWTKWWKFKVAANAK